MSALSYCDCCNAPMVAVSHYGPECSAGCDTDACLLCGGAWQPTAEDLLAEIEDLTPHAADARVLARIEQLAKLAAVYDVRRGL